MWPDTPETLTREQQALARHRAADSYLFTDDAVVGGCFVCFSADGGAFAGAALTVRTRLLATALASGTVDARYVPGMLALREGPVLEQAVRALPTLPEVLVVNATGLDHPRGAGLAVHLGAVLDLPTVGVTHRPLLAIGAPPPQRRGATAPLRLPPAAGEEAVEPVAAWVCTRSGARPVAAHAGWHTDVDTAVRVLLAVSRSRTPEPVRRARQAARRARGRAARLA